MSAYFINIFRMIKHAWNRFVAIISIVTLGVAFFVGIRAAGPDMRITADQYYDDQNFMDIRIISPIGFNDDDVSAIFDTDGVSDAAPLYTADVLVQQEEISLVVHMISLDLQNMEQCINKPVLVEGRFPENNDECVVDARFLQNNHYNIGDTIHCYSGDSEDIQSTLHQTGFVIVGSVNSPVYMSIERGYSTIGNGSVNSFILIPSESFALPYYTEIVLTAQKDSDISRFSNLYTEHIEELSERLSDLGQTRMEISNTAMPKWFVLGIDKNMAFADYKENCSRIDSIGMVFPLIFFLVAALVSLTSMTRLVENDRMEIGTLKALGYSRFAIAAKFIIFSLLAGILGCFFGFLIGFPFFPRLIADAYGIIYDLPPVLTPYHLGLSIISSAFALICITVPTILVCMAELSRSPAALIQPKSPPAGKRIFLEYVPIIWKHMNFTKKVTARNLFRYKKRLLMTIIGVAGCTALLFTGFGLRYSIYSVVPFQFEKIRRYDLELNIKPQTSDAQTNSLIEMLDNHTYIDSIMPFHQQSVDVSAGSHIRTADLIVPLQFDGLQEFITFRERIGKSTIPLTDDGIIITEKLASLLDVKAGDLVSLMNRSNIEVDVTIASICENYIFHYIYITPALFEQLYETVPVTNQILGKLNGTSVSDQSALSVENALSAEILERDYVSAISFNTNIRNNFDKMISALNIVVLVLILSAAALAFVVLFSLTSINIDERIRELATIKVLGFTTQETASYIYRENIILATMGATAGLFLGILLHGFVIVTAEVDMTMFNRDVSPMNYVYAFLLTLLFACLVNLSVIARIRKIDMVESLKSVE